MDAGYGACVLRDARAAQIIEENWKHFHGERYDLIAWVIMPNHCHVLIRQYRDSSLGKIVQSWKTYTAHMIKSQTPLFPLFPLWQREYWDRYIRDDVHFTTAVEYIHNNPVKAGLCRNPEDWQFSSARLCKQTD